MLELKQIIAGYGQNIVLNGLSLKVEAGEVFALLGGNGAGKSTTIKLILKQIKPQSGKATFDNIGIESANANIAYIPENVALYGHLSAVENIEYFMALRGEKPTQDSIRQALFTSGLPSEFIGQRVSGFSKGMRQKTAIALSILQNAKLLLLDEPTSGLDPKAIEDFHNIIVTMCKNGAAILMVTHDLLGASKIADKIGFLYKGKIEKTIDRKNGGLNLDELYAAYNEIGAVNA